MTTTTQDGTTTTADTAGTTTTRPVDTDVPDAAQVGSADFKPGSLYKGPTVDSASRAIRLRSAPGGGISVGLSAR